MSNMSFTGKHGNKKEPLPPRPLPQFTINITGKRD